MALRTATGKAGVEGETIWKISSHAGSSLREFEVGRTTAGFVETVPLGEIDRDTSYVAVITPARKGLNYVTPFVPNSLEPSMWELAADELLTDEEFDDLRPCD